MYQIAFLLLSSLLFLGCTKKDAETKKGIKTETQKSAISLPYYNEPTFTPVFVDGNNDVQKKITHTIGDFSFLNQDSILVKTLLFCRILLRLG